MTRGRLKEWKREIQNQPEFRFVEEFITALEEAWGEIDNYQEGTEGLRMAVGDLRDRAEQAEAEIDKLREEHAESYRIAGVFTAECDAWREKAAEYCRDWQRVGKQLGECEVVRDAHETELADLQVAHNKALAALAKERGRVRRLEEASGEPKGPREE